MNQNIININTNENEFKKYNLKNDVIFKAFFAKRGNEQFLIDFLTGLLKIEIKEITIEEEVDILTLSTIEKGGRIDLQATLADGTIVSIEMQVRDEHNIERRSEFNASGILRSSTKKGTNYEDIHQVIMVNILDYSFLDVEDYVSETTTVLNGHREYELPSLIKHYYIELPKFRKQNPDMNNKLNQWLALIDDMDGGRTKMAEEKNETIKNAKEEVNCLTGEAAVRRLAELRERWDRDRASELSFAKDLARRDGLEEGRAEGKALGIAEGRAEGKKENQLEVAKKMLDEKMPIEIIIKITGLSEKEILRLRN